MRDLRVQLLSTTALLALCGTAYATPPAPAQMPSWAGFYVGANVGVGSLNASATETAGYGYGYGACAGGYGGVPGSCVTSATGVVAGPELGYDWQMGSFVFGLVGDWSFTSLKHTVNAAPDFAEPGTFTAQVNWLASGRARMGVDVFDSLIYVTGGLALGHLESNTWAPGASGNGGTYGSLNTTKVGWVAGMGIDHKLNRQWSIKGEFLYYNLGTQASPVVTRASTTYGSEFTHEVMVGQVGLEYHF